MTNFLDVMRELETGGYPGISQVYLCILQYELNDQLCALHHVSKHTCIQPSIVQKYMQYLINNSFIIIINGETYDTYKTKVVRATAKKRQESSLLMRDIVHKLPMNFGEASQMERLVKEIAQKSRDEDSLMRELTSIQQSIVRFKDFIGLRSGKDLVELLAIINSQFDCWSSLKQSQLRQLLVDKHNATQAMANTISRTLDETTERSRRVGRNFALVLKRNPEWRTKNGKVIRQEFKEFYYGHVYDFPEDTVPIELIEQELAHFDPPIIIGD